MKVLMLHDCAYVGYELAKELRKRGVQVQHLWYHETLGFSIKKVLKISEMYLKTLVSDCDFIHAHYLGIASYIAFFSGKPYVVHIHGSDIRNPITKKSTITALRFVVLDNAKLILYSTPDLRFYLPDRALYLPTPVGKQFQKYIETGCKNFFSQRKLWYTKLNKNVNAILKDHKYDSMPYVLNCCFLFIDQNKVKALSKTALEALACGCNVVNWEGNIISGRLPENHKVKNVVDKLLSYYKLSGLY